MMLFRVKSDLRHQHQHHQNGGGGSGGRRRNRVPLRTSAR